MKNLTLLIITLLTSVVSHASCSYLPQGIIDAWAGDRNLWTNTLAYEPVMEGTYPDLALSAFRITHLDEHSFIYEAGVRSGDQIVAVNEVPVGDLEALSLFLESVSQQQEISLAFKERETIRFLNASLNPELQCFSDHK
jgi:hypothetical protein